jgi:very-short-patch-repair endonuclease
MLPSGVAGNRDVNQATFWGQQCPQLRRASVAQCCAAAACEHRSHPFPLIAQPSVPDGGYAAMHPVQPPCRDPPRNPGAAEPMLEQLNRGDHAVPAWELRRAIRQAEFPGLPTGVATDGTRSDPEPDFLRLCRRHRIPAPEVNQRIGRFTVDFVWREQRLVVESDAWTTHRGFQAFEDDHRRDLELMAVGYRVLRFTAAQIRNHPSAIAAALRAELGLAVSFR